MAFVLKNIFKNLTIKNGILFSIYSFVNSGFSFILLLILAKYITADEYGKLSLFTIVIQVLKIFICLGAQGYVAVSFFRNKGDKFKSVLTLVFVISTLMYAIYTVSLLLFPVFFERILGLNLHVLLIASLVCYLQVFNTQCLEIIRIQENVAKYGLLSISFALFNFIISILLVVTLNLGWMGRVYTTVLVTGLYFIISLLFFCRNKMINFSSTKELYKETLKFGLPLLPHHTGVWLRQSFDRFVINAYHASSVVGLYSFAGNFANILLMIGTAFNNVNSVQIYKELGKGYLASKPKLDKVIRYSTIGFIILAVFIVLCCYLFIPMFFPNYVNSRVYLVPLILSSFFQCIYLLNVNYLFFYKKTVALMYITVSFSLLQLVLSLLLTKYDVMYTAVINMAINGLICLFVLLYKKRLCKCVELSNE